MDRGKWLPKEREEDRRREKIWILRVGKIINIFSFMRMRRRNFYLVFIRISVVLDKFPFLPFPQTCEHNKKCCGLGEDVDDHRF